MNTAPASDNETKKYYTHNIFQLLAIRMKLLAYNLKQLSYSQIEQAK
jgi:hypothetical protein